MPRIPLLLEEVQYLVASASDRRPDSMAASAAIYDAVSSDFPSGHSHRALATALVHHVFNRAITLVSLGQYPSVYLELHALLEDAAILLLPNYLAKTGQRALVSDLLKRRTLSDVAPIYVQLGYWSKSDLAFVKSLAAVRNGVAHHNFELLEKHLPRIGDERSVDSFRFDLPGSSKALANTLRLIIQASRPHKRKAKLKVAGSN